MGLRHLGEIAARLVAAGRDPDERVAIISKATTKAQRVLTTTLGAAAADAETHRVETPAIIVIGPVVDLGATLDWFAPR
jgi:uroporphyrin-III C-methyltransferase